jgi:hypothetical protein
MNHVSLSLSFKIILWKLSGYAWQQHAPRAQVGHSAARLCNLTQRLLGQCNSRCIELNALCHLYTFGGLVL